MSFEQRRELLFVYSVKDANPNGDPLDNNSPRVDEDSGQILVSDVRVKRTARDQWLREGREVFVDGEIKTLKSRVDELKDKFGVGKGQDALSHCLDVRLFGVTCASGDESDAEESGAQKKKGKKEKNSFAWTGPVQFKWGRSLHRAAVKTVQGTAAFAKNESSMQRSIRYEYIVPFVLIADYAIANQYASLTTGATDEDLDALFSALWKGTANLITRSKVGHMPRFLLEVRYVKGFDGIIGAMDEKVRLLGADGHILGADEQRALRSCDEVFFDITMLSSALARVSQDVERVRILHDSALRVKGMEELKGAVGGKLALEER
ncbi:type I-B CRISPR-associated protein Cas7/Csh2 [uncultured Fretibacterium sp.]|uniref:type I-B CRISPR-associated protein Cas7/Csh2 n=1 Tax=uncultured Fretibacterium sp. TaxID=1678694 RepID=UPI00325FAA4F